MADNDGFRLSDAYETDLPEMVDYRTLEYNRAYFAEQEARERQSESAASPRESKRRSKGTHSSEVNRGSNETEHDPSPRTSQPSPTKSSRQRSSRRSQTQPATEDEPALQIPTAPPSEDAEEESTARYSVKELVATIGSQEEVSKLPAELQRRVLDFRLAQQKRREKYGRQRKFGTL